MDTFKLEVPFEVILGYTGLLCLYKWASVDACELTVCVVDKGTHVAVKLVWIRWA